MDGCRSNRYTVGRDSSYFFETALGKGHEKRGHPIFDSLCTILLLTKLHTLRISISACSALQGRCVMLPYVGAKLNV